MDPKDGTKRVLKALNEARKERGWGGLGWLDRKVGNSAGYVGRLLAGKISMRLEQLFEILSALEFEPGEFFAWVFGKRYRIRPDRILQRIERRAERTAILTRLDTILCSQQEFISQQLESPPGEEDQAELDRLNELRFSYPATAKEDCLELLTRSLEEIEGNRGSLPFLCDCVSLLGAIEVVLDHSPLAACYLRRAFSMAKLLHSTKREASVLQMYSYLVANHGDYETAIAFEEEACTLYIISNDMFGVGKTLVDRGNMYFYLGEHLASSQYYEAALLYLPERMWTHRFQAYQCLGFVHLQLERVDDAYKYADLAAREHETREGVNWWKLMWLRGEIAILRDDLVFSESVFRELSDEFYAQESYIDTALVSLRLAKVLMLSGKAQEMQKLSSSMMALMEPLKAENEIAGATVHEFLRLALVGEVTVDFLDRAYEDIQLITEKRSLTSKTS